ncbi:NUDIX domain-containing protein [Vibrio kyushuensis]|uniref:NUDIX domain-containing protein n=1 Tax=Vibrio kyushuensis TaxID=2910249 RepID=UPI003D0AD503
MIKRMLLLVLTGFSLLVSSHSLASEMPESIRGALCIVKADDKIVLVHEILTKKISLPGGTIDPREEPSLTAQRETWEETGLVVSVGDVLGYTDTAVIYDCVSDSEVIAYEYNNDLDGNAMPIWFAPHYGVEVSSAMLLSPEKLPYERYRYPEQWDAIKALYVNATDQSTTYVSELIEAAPVLNQAQLNWILSMQQSVSSMPDVVSNSVDAINMVLSQLIKPWVLLVVFPLLYWRFGKEFSYKAFFAITVTSLLSLVAQQGFSIPRPHAYIPAIDMMHSYGFSFPSLPIAVWFCVVTLILRELDNEERKPLMIGFIGFVLVLALSKFYSGTAFLWDMGIGAILGVLVAWHIIRLEAKPDVDVQSLLCSRALWVALTIGTVALTVIWPLPVFTEWLAILVTTTGLVMTLDRDQQTMSLSKVISMIVVLLILNFTLLFAATFVSYSSMFSLILESLRFPVLMLAYVGAVRKLSH